VMTSAQVQHLDGTWIFRPGVDEDALAVVRDDTSVCSLVAGRDAAEAFCVTRVHFEAGMDNSGFVGWLASTLKERIGTGVFVVCGDNPAQGGIYDYWGYPLGVADDVRLVIDELARPSLPDLLPAGLEFAVETICSSSLIGADDRLWLEHDGTRLCASYSGAYVAQGSLVGQVTSANSAAVAYAQLHRDGTVAHGRSTLTWTSDGDAWVMVEDYDGSNGHGRNTFRSLT
jgi:hypothetical protein